MTTIKELMTDVRNANQFLSEFDALALVSNNFYIKKLKKKFPFRMNNLNLLDELTLPLFDSCKAKIFPSANDTLINFREIERNFRAQVDDHYAFSISPSTPCIEYKSNEWIGVGHVKFTPTKVNSSTNLTKFLESIENLKVVKHFSDLIYLMFFYTFAQDSPQSFVVNKISSMFVIYTGKYILNFPSGLCSTSESNKMILSFGDGDQYSKCIIFNPHEIEWKDASNDIDLDFELVHCKQIQFCKSS